MFDSLFSNRYNGKRDLFYAQYEEKRKRFPNLPLYQRPKEPARSTLKFVRKRRRHADYDYDEWIAGHFVSIVVRRTIERWSCRQLMEPAGGLGADGCTWRCWPEESSSNEPRRSSRLADRPNLRLKQMSQPSGKDTTDSTENGQQQQLVNKPEDEDVEQTLTFIDGCQLECSMCCQHFGQNCDLQLHSLDDCRKYLLATLPKSSPAQLS